MYDWAHGNGLECIQQNLGQERTNQCAWTDLETTLPYN